MPLFSLSDPTGVVVALRGAIQRAQNKARGGREGGREGREKAKRFFLTLKFLIFSFSFSLSPYARSGGERKEKKRAFFCLLCD